MAVIDVESRFDRWAVSHAGAVGLMQVMPFWPRQLGMTNQELVRIPQNVRMGCTILKFYLDRENGDYTRALARYNGSVGRTQLLRSGADRASPSAGSTSEEASGCQKRDRAASAEVAKRHVLRPATSVTCAAGGPCQSHSISDCTAAARRRRALRRARQADCARSRAAELERLAAGSRHDRTRPARARTRSTAVQ